MLSIIVVSYNTSRLTRECIRSVLDSDGKLKKEIIVVDNGSTDGSVGMLRRFQKRKLIKLLLNTTNLGFAKANNQGIKQSNGKYIFLLNSDTKVEQDTFKSLLEFASSHNNLGAVVPRLLNPDGSVQESVFKLPTLWRAIKQYWFGQKNLMQKYYPIDDSPTEVESAVMAAFLITPIALKKVGLLNEKYFMFYEDLDYCRSLKKQGLKIYYLPNIHVFHYHGASGKKLVETSNQWRRLVPSSKKYHGLIIHYLIYFVTWTNQKANELFHRSNA